MLEYYGFLAARMPAGRLLETAALRALRVARTRLAPRPAPPSRDELLEGFRCESGAELAQRLAEGARGIAAGDRAALRAALTEHFPASVSRAAERAAAAAAGRLRVFGHEVEVSRPSGGTDWQLDPLHGGRFPSWEPSEGIGTLPGSDPKAAWAVGRGEQWVALACGAVADPARADAFAAACVASIRDFVAANPVGRGVQWACPMEAALRVVCLGQAHALLRGLPALRTGHYAFAATRLAIATGRFVLARIEDFNFVPNTHLAAEWVGLLACAVFAPEWPEASRWRAAAVTGLQRELAAQTHPEGTSFEGSVPQQRFALEVFTAGQLLARLAGAPLGDPFDRRLAALYAATRALLARDGALPQIGDHDSDRVFAFGERAPLDGSYLLPLGAAVTGDPRLRVQPGSAGAEEVLWLMGPGALERISQEPPGPRPRSAAFPLGGFHALRRGALEAFISCGPNGQNGIGGHSHNDKLAFELRVGGRLAICDPGSPAYTHDAEERNHFRSTRAHATLVVDGLEQAPIPPDRLFALPDAARARLLALESTARWERFAGEHRGFASAGVIHRRDLLLLEGGAIVADALAGGGVHAIELRFPFPSADARLRPLTREERTRLVLLLGQPEPGAPRPPAPDLLRAVEIGPAASPIAVLAVAAPARLSVALVPAPYSPGYAQRVEALAAVFSGRVEAPATLLTAILPLASGVAVGAARDGDRQGTGRAL